MSDVKNTVVKTDNKQVNKAISDIKATLIKLQERIVRLEKKVG